MGLTSREIKTEIWISFYKSRYQKEFIEYVTKLNL